MEEEIIKEEKEKKEKNEIEEMKKIFNRIRFLKLFLQSLIYLFEYNNMTKKTILLAIKEFNIIIKQNEKINLENNVIGFDINFPQRVSSSIPLKPKNLLSFDLVKFFNF
jgi:hypothetical protein